MLTHLAAALLGVFAGVTLMLWIGHRYARAKQRSALARAIVAQALASAGTSSEVSDGTDAIEYAIRAAQLKRRAGVKTPGGLS